MKKVPTLHKRVFFFLLTCLLVLITKVTEVVNSSIHLHSPYLSYCIDNEMVKRSCEFGSLLLDMCLVVFQFQLFSTWGDPYYVGLNGLEFYDESGYRIRLTENDITAYPHSVNVLEGVTDDIRTPDKLIDGVNDTSDGRHMWLAPILPGIVRKLFNLLAKQSFRY